jgi:hypothetical protein
MSKVYVTDEAGAIREPLTVAGLIEVLSKMPQDAFVVIDGYEWGVGRVAAENVKQGVAVLDEEGTEFDVVHLDREDSPDQRSYGARLEIKDE